MKPIYRYLALAVVLGAVAAIPQSPPVRYVDADCPVAGTGESLDCGPTGPFRDLPSALAVAQCGDHVAVRAGRYEGTTTIRHQCAPGNELLIGGCGAAEGCPSQEVPLLTGWRRHVSWVETTPGTWGLALPDAIEDVSVFNRGESPTMVVEEGQALQYIGDNVMTPPDGYWSYVTLIPSQPRIFVNPRGFSPVLVEVAFYPHVVVFAPRSSGAVLHNVNVWGGRSRLVVIGASGSITPGHRIEDTSIRFPPYMGIHAHGARQLALRNVSITDGCQGWDGTAVGRDPSCFAFREFESDGLAVEGLTVERFGSYADAPPTNGPRASSSLVDIKYTQDATLTNLVIRRGPAQPLLRIDASHRVTVRDALLEFAGRGVGIGNVTPIPPFPRFQGNEAIQLTRVTINGTTIAGVQVGDQPEPGATEWVRFETVLVSPTSGEEFILPSDPRIVFADPTVTTSTVASTTTTVTYQCVRHWLCAMGTWFKWCRVPCPPNSVCGQPGVICG